LISGPSIVQPHDAVPRLAFWNTKAIIEKAKGLAAGENGRVALETPLGLRIRVFTLGPDTTFTLRH